MEHQQSRSESRSYLEYQEITQPKIIEQIEQKYRPAINSLKENGFGDLHILRQTTASFGLIAFFLMPLKGEAFSLGKWLSLNTFHPVLSAADYGTFAQLSTTTSAKFYTAFTDESWLVSATLFSLSHEALGDNVRHFEYASSLSVEEAWQFHKKKAEELMATGKEVNHKIRSEDYLLRPYWVDSADEFYKGCGGLLLFAVTFLLSVVTLIVTVETWPDMSGWLRCGFTLFVFVFPHVVARWYQKQLNYMKIL